MHDYRYAGDADRLRRPERLALLEVDRVVNLSMKGIEPANVLDVGTGTGIFAEAFAARGAGISGIDPNPQLLNRAIALMPEGKFLSGVVEDLPFEDKSFDLVFLGHVLHESDDRMKALSECARCARKRVAVLEWPYTAEEIGPPIEHRLRIEEILEPSRSLPFTSIDTIKLSHMVLVRFNF
ncbi:MAG TPA: class I SAM-dependent methyltransferase [Bacteroidota bacterium]|nr:class I SAM-dependent methyltransferase [Bacteroidota bacterium]